MEVLALAGTNRMDNETVAQAFEVYKNSAGASGLSNPDYHVVDRGDLLSKIAMKFYGNIHKWPLIYEANREVIGRDPNLLKPGQPQQTDCSRTTYRQQRTDILRQVTMNARVAAEEFEKYTEVIVGDIRSARQGNFSVCDVGEGYQDTRKIERTFGS